LVTQLEQTSLIKKKYDPRVWIRKAEEAMATRVGVSMDKLGSVGTYPASSEPGEAQLGAGKKSMNPILLLSAGVALGSAATMLMKK